MLTKMACSFFRIMSDPLIDVGFENRQSMVEFISEIWCWILVSVLSFQSFKTIILFGLESFVMKIKGERRLMLDDVETRKVGSYPSCIQVHCLQFHHTSGIHLNRRDSGYMHPLHLGHSPDRSFGIQEVCDKG